MAKCSVNDCNTKARASGLCTKHYARIRLTGTIDPGPKAQAPIEERFKRHFFQGEADVCWLWTGTLNHSGYGLIAVGTKSAGQLLAHRVSWTIANGEMPEGKWVVMHSCDRPACVNPKHLRLGTQAENLQDMRAKDRGFGGFSVAPIQGDKHHSAKFTEAQVREIRASTENSTLMAKRLGVNRASIIKIRARVTWKHLD